MSPLLKTQHTFKIKVHLTQHLLSGVTQRSLSTQVNLWFLNDHVHMTEAVLYDSPEPQTGLLSADQLKKLTDEQCLKALYGWSSLQRAGAFVKFKGRSVIELISITSLSSLRLGKIWQMKSVFRYAEDSVGF